MLRAGFCGTDAALVAGVYAFTGIPGHEFVGRVAAGPESLAGKRVVGEINVVCGTCGMCRSGLKKHCVRRSALELLAAGSVDPEPLIDAPYSLDQGVEGLERSRRSGRLNVLLDIGA